PKHARAHTHTLYFHPSLLYAMKRNLRSGSKMKKHNKTTKRLSLEAGKKILQQLEEDIMYIMHKCRKKMISKYKNDPAAQKFLEYCFSDLSWYEAWRTETHKILLEHVEGVGRSWKEDIAAARGGHHVHYAQVSKEDDFQYKNDPAAQKFLEYCFSDLSCPKHARAHTHTLYFLPSLLYAMKRNLRSGSKMKKRNKGSSDTSKTTERLSLEAGKKILQQLEEDIIMSRWLQIFKSDLDRCDIKQLNLGVGTERMIFNIDSAMKHFYSNDDTCFSIDVIYEILEEDFDALLNEGSKILHFIEGTLLEEEIFAEFDEFMAMTAKEKSDSESETEDPPFEKITINIDYKIKTSLKEPLTDLELKPHPDNLEYVFLEELYFLPVIISSQHSKEKKDKIVSILKRHKQAFA
nr:reverse transcriptase domain-containing protein [Tanacetum cinerariifolium]